MKVPVLALIVSFVLIFSVAGSASLLLIGNHGSSNQTACTVGLVNSTSFIWKPATYLGTFPRLLYYSPTLDYTLNQVLLGSAYAYGYGTCNQNYFYGESVINDLLNSRIWYSFVGGTTDYIYYYDLLSHTVSSPVISKDDGAFNGMSFNLNASTNTAYWTGRKLGAGYINNGSIFSWNNSMIYGNPNKNMFDFGGIKYITFANAVIYKLNPSSFNGSNNTVYNTETLSAITTGTESAPFLFFNVNAGDATVPAMLFSSDEAGNIELYWAMTNQTASKHRLTATAGNEMLDTAWQSPYGTVYLVYTNASYVEQPCIVYSGCSYSYPRGFTFTLDYFCPYTNSTLGTVCDGETGYAGVAPLAPNETGINATMPNNITQINLYLQVYDNARCSTYGLGGKCKAFYLTNEDWLYAIFTVNGQPPAVGANTTCYAHSASESIQLIQNNPNNPFGIVSPFAPNFSVQVHSGLFNPVSMENEKIVVTCYTTDIDSGQSFNISVPFFVQDTDNNLIARQWSDIAGSSKDLNYDDIVNLHDFVNIKTNIVEQSNNYNGWCWNNLGSKIDDASAFNGIQNAGKNLQTGENNFQFLYDYKTDEVGYSTLPNGYNYYTTRCGSWATAGNPRRSSEAEQRRLYVFDRCAGTNEGTTKLLTRFYDGNPEHIATTTGVFFIGQQPEMEITYRASYGTSDPFATKQTVPNPVCTVTFTHSNSTIMFSQTFYRDQIENIGCLFSDSPTGKYCDIPIILAMTDNNGNQLPVGNYTYDISCINKETNLCLPDVSSSGSFSFSNTPANCAGTVESCGTGEACDSCAEGILFECENPDYSINIPQECYNQYCLDVASTDTSTLIGRYIASPPCSIYSVTAGYNQLTSTMSCAKKANLLFYGIVNKLTQQADIGSDGSCELKFYEKYSSTLLGKINLGYGNAMKWNSLTKRFELSYADLKKEWASRVSDGDFLQCGTNYRMEVKCSSSLFKVAHVGTFDFSLGGLDFCSDGTSSGSCVFERTLNDADKPFYCDTNFALINNSQTCGCPIGLRANSSTNSCYGNRSTNEVSKDDIKGWLIAIFNNWWLVLIIMIAVILMFKKQRIEHT